MKIHFPCCLRQGSRIGRSQTPCLARLLILRLYWSSFSHLYVSTCSHFYQSTCLENNSALKWKWLDIARFLKRCWLKFDGIRSCSTCRYFNNINRPEEEELLGKYSKIWKFSMAFAIKGEGSRVHKVFADSAQTKYCSTFLCPSVC